MELIDYIHILRRRWILIALVVIACVGGAVAATKLTTPTYQATSRLIIGGYPVVTSADEVASGQLAAQRATAFAQIISTAPAVQAALKEAEAQAGPFEPSGYPSISASADGTDPFVTIDVTDTDPRRAKAVANAFPIVLPSVLGQLGQPTTTPHEIEILQAASLPTKPLSPNPRENLIIGLALGVVLGVAAAFVVEALDRRLKDSADVEAASGLTALGVVPFELPKEPIPAKTHPRSVRAEAYRQVRTNLAFASENDPPKSIIITSSASSEGKTSLAVNLAITCARSGQRVALVDADLRRPMVHVFLDMPEYRGLVNVLAGTVELSDALQFSETGPMDVLVSGPVPTNPSELLGSETMVKTIRQLESNYDIVIIDSPPVLPVTDALLIGVHVDAVVVVARLGQATRDRIRRTTAALAHVKASVAGVVPNGAIKREDSAYSYASRYSSKRPPPDTSYGFSAPVVAPEPGKLHPAFSANGNGKAHEPSSEPDWILVESEWTLVEDAAFEPRGKHAATERGPEPDNPVPPPQV